MKILIHIPSSRTGALVGVGVGSGVGSGVGAGVGDPGTGTGVGDPGAQILQVSPHSRLAGGFLHLFAT